MQISDKYFDHLKKEINDIKHIRDRMLKKKAKEPTQYTMDQKLQCKKLFDQGLASKEVHLQTKIPVNTIREWKRRGFNFGCKSYYSPEFQKKTVDEFDHNKQSFREFAKEKQIPFTTFYGWYKKLK